MLSTAVSILAAIALLMPGFIVAELSVARSARASRSDLELALRALTYTLIVHLVFGFWTAHLVKTVGSPEGWVDHVRAISVYAAIVLLGVPIAVGGLLNRYLAGVEPRDRPPNLFAAGLGGGEGSDAFDYAYQRWCKDGTWIIVELVDHTADSPRLVGGIFGRRSAVGRTPLPHDIFLEALCKVEVDENGIRNLAERIDPERGVYIAASQIARVDLVSEGPATL
jgi:hypothetical protein